MPTTETDTTGPGTRRPRFTPRPVYGSVEELLAGATSREPMDKPGDSKSGSTFERVVIDGRPHVLKHLHVDQDWLARATGDLTCRPLTVWQTGLLDALPPSIDHAVRGAAGGLGRHGLGAALLLRDVGGDLVPEGSSALPAQQHARFIGHMADLHAVFWGWSDDIGLQPLTHRLYELSPVTGDVEAELGSADVVPTLLRPGWERLRRDVPDAAEIAWSLLDDPAPLVDALAAGPQTLVHGDWKAGNLGTTPEGRTILLDWAIPGQAPGLLDLAWYLAVNCDRIPESKDDTIARYRVALEDRGIATEPWWAEQLPLALVVGFVQLGWNKEGDELRWWADRVVAAASCLR